MSNSNFNRLCNEIKDIEKYIAEDKIKVIKVRKNSKIPSENDYYNAPVKLEDLKKHSGNYGILVGYNHNKTGSSIAVIDIDGYKMANVSKEKKIKIKKETSRLIYEALKDIPEALIVRTQSGGHHIILWNETILDNIHEVSKNLYFPSNFPIAELRNKSLKDSIEIFTKQGSKQCVLPSSTIKNKGSNNIRRYKVESKVNKLSDVATVNDISKTVIETLTAKGYTYKESEEKTVRKKSRSSNRKETSNLKKLNDNEIKKVVELTVPIFEATEGAKHTTTLYLGGFFSYHITKTSSKRIASGIVKEIGSIFEDSKAFKKTLLESYERKVDKAGLPKLIEHIEEHDSNFNVNKFKEELNIICNKNFRKEKVATVTINKIEVPVYLFETDVNKWLKYEGIIEGVDLTLDISSNIGSFKYTKTGKEITSFKFKFNNNYFEVVKLRDLTNFLASEEVKLPDYFEEHIRRSLNNLDKSITKPKEKSSIASAPEEVDVEEDPNFLTFGSTEEGFYSQSSKNGIEYNVNIL